MDDIPMVDDSPEALLAHQNFSVEVVLGSDDHKGPGSSFSPGDGPAFKSDYYEENEVLVADNLKRLYPHVDFKKQQVPRHWNTIDRYHSLNISTDMLRVKYRGTVPTRHVALTMRILGKGQTHKDAAAVRANCPIPRSCGVYYFEVLIVSKGINGYMGIGLSERNVNLNRLPGWDPISYGYHGDDGNFFASSGKGVEYGPTFTTGDIVGCGINFVTREIFFTKNGRHLGVAATNIPITNDLYPTVGMQTMNETADANFGQKKFEYDIEADQNGARNKVLTMIRNMELPQEKAIWMNRAVSSWLAQEGYTKALESFNKATGQMETEPNESIDARRSLIKLVLSRNMAEAINYVEENFPLLLEENKQLALMLKTQQFVDMLIAIHQDTSSMNGSSHGTSQSSDNSETYSQSAPTTSRGTGGNSKRANLKRRSSQENEHRQSPRRAMHDSPAVPADFRNGNSSSTSHPNEEPMDTAETCTNGRSATNGRAAGLSSTTIITEPIDGEENGDSLDMNVIDGLPAPQTQQELLNGYSKIEVLPFEKYQQIIEFGQSIFALYKQIPDCPTRLAKRMNDAFSLICYTDFNQAKKDQPDLFKQEHREEAAKALNSVILQQKGKENVSPLDKNLKLAFHEHGKGIQVAGTCVYADPSVMVFGESHK